jgi:RNA polymerase sigma factor (sigma-70 family)
MYLILTKGLNLHSGNKTQLFEVTGLQHLNAAYNLARWMMNSDADAKDAVQTASIRALHYIDNLRGADAKPWFLGIVRNCCLDLLNERLVHHQELDIDTLLDSLEELESLGASPVIPEHLLIQKNNRALVNMALAKVPVSFREVLVLREMEDMSYEQIAVLMAIPIGTVMSRLSRAKLYFKKVFIELSEGQSL